MFINNGRTEFTNINALRNEKKNDAAHLFVTPGAIVRPSAIQKQTSSLSFSSTDTLTNVKSTEKKIKKITLQKANRINNH